MLLRALALLLITFVTAAHAQVCANPAKPCPGFKVNDLSFKLPTDGLARAETKSPRFYAVILHTAKLCSIQESEREQLQALFPHNKVFYTHFECAGDPANNVTYTNFNDNFAFVAVYAGEERTAADAFLWRVNAMNRFPGANLRRMEVVFVSP